ncbi:hypothetical protein D3C75_570460 [compost metagenome]
MNLIIEIPLWSKIYTLQDTLIDHLGNLGLRIGKGILTVECDPSIQPQDIGNPIFVTEETKRSYRLIMFEEIVDTGHIGFEGRHILLEA